MSLCILAGAKTVALAVSAFTLAWTHSIEKTEWEEDWQIASAGLQLVEARVKGSGAGMEPAQDARLVDSWWVWRPALPPQAEIVLAASGETGGGWRICTIKGCQEVGAKGGETVVLSACPAGAGPF